MAEVAEPGGGRPIGWWLKEADAAVDRAFDAALDGTGVDRRGWQVLATLSRGPTHLDDLAEALRAFDDRARVEAVVDELAARGWVERRDDDALQLSDDGSRVQRDLAGRVTAVRSRVAAALPGADYGALAALLARLVEGLGGTPGAADGGGRRS